MGNESTNPYLDEYHEKGFLGPIDILNSAEVALCYRDFQNYRDAQPITGDARFKTHLILPWVRRLVHHPKILKVLDPLLGPNILCWSSDWNIKPADSDSHYTPHQDAAYAGLHPPQDVLTVWLALTPSTMESGAIHFWPNTHTAPLAHTERPGDSGNALVYGQVCPTPAHVAPIPIVLQPGQISIHHFWSVHASYPNTSSFDRVGLAIRYMRASVRQRGTSARELVTVVAGRMEHEGFDDEGEGGVAVREVALAREATNYLATRNGRRCSYDDAT